MGKCLKTFQALPALSETETESGCEIQGSLEKYSKILKKKISNKSLFFENIDTDSLPYEFDHTF